MYIDIRQWERKKELGLKPISTQPYFKVRFFVLTLQPNSTVSFNAIFFFFNMYGKPCVSAFKENKTKLFFLY